MTRFERKIDAFFWFIVMVLPLLVFLCLNYRVSTADFTTFIAGWRFDFFADIFTDIFALGDCVMPVCFVDYLSYASMTIFAHILFDCVVFIPRLAHNFLEVFYRGKD